MLASTRTFSLDGILARAVRVEVDVHRGLPAFQVVGLPDAAVREARERIRAALINCGFEFPLRRIAVNLAPASLRKAGPGFDLPIAAGLLEASGQLPSGALSQMAMVGELSLDGSLRPVPGALAMAEAARDTGASAIVVPAENGAETALASGIEVIALESLRSLPDLARGEWRSKRPEPLPLRIDPSPSASDLADLRGQPHLHRVLEVTAAGGHSLLMIGAPGSGRSLAASRLPSLLPLLGTTEALEVTRIASSCGRVSNGPYGERPFRAPHHTISPAGLMGGGTPSRPGEATLAHRGVLYLDELGEFRRDALEALQAPLETGAVTIGRVTTQSTLPARFTFVAAANPCPCGRGEFDPDCVCPQLALRRYQARLNGHFAKAIEIHCVVRPPTAAEIAGPPGETSAEVRQRVSVARERQECRLGPGRCNAEMTSAETFDCPLDTEAATVLANSLARARVNGPEHRQVIRLAQTLADLDGTESIGRTHAEEALALRSGEPR